VLLSDHGFGPKPERSVRINRWLADHGFLRRRPFWTMRRRVVRQLFPEPWRSRYDTTDFILVDRARSRAWAETIFTGTAGVWVNVRGRYPDGCVEPGSQYESVRESIRRGLSDLRDEQARPSSSAAAAMYAGPFVGEAPTWSRVGRSTGCSSEPSERLRVNELFGPFELGYTGRTIPIICSPPFAALRRSEDHPIEAIASTPLAGVDRAISSRPVRAEHPPRTRRQRRRRRRRWGPADGARDEEQVAEHLARSASRGSDDDARPRRVSAS
jgi:hypothetical protein